MDGKKIRAHPPTMKFGAGGVPYSRQSFAQATAGHKLVVTLAQDSSSMCDVRLLGDARRNNERAWFGFGATSRSAVPIWWTSSVAVTMDLSWGGQKPSKLFLNLNGIKYWKWSESLLSTWSLNWRRAPDTRRSSWLFVTGMKYSILVGVSCGESSDLRQINRKHTQCILCEQV